MAIDINGDGLIAVGGTSTTQGRVRLAEDTDNGTNYVELTSNAAITTNRTVTFPDANIDFTTGLGAAQGGTGATTLTAENVVIGNGTSAVKFVAPGTTGNVLTSNGSAWLSQAAAAGGGDYIMQVFTSPGTWTKAAGLKAIKVTVIGGGGSNGPAAGGTSSFGAPAFLSATGGAGVNGGGTGGSGSGGQINASGSGAAGPIGTGQITGTSNCQPVNISSFGIGGASAFGFGGARYGGTTGGAAGFAGVAYGGGAAITNGGGGGGGGAIEYIDAPALPGPQPYTVGVGGPGTFSGGAGIIVVEEFY